MGSVRAATNGQRVNMSDGAFFRCTAWEESRKVVDAINRALDAARSEGVAEGLREAANLICERCKDDEPGQFDGFAWGHIDQDSDPEDVELTDCNAMAIRQRLTRLAERSGT